MFDRHSHVAVPRETQFYHKFVRDDRPPPGDSHEAMVNRAMEDYFIRHVGLSAEQILDEFRGRSCSHPDLLLAILAAYSRRQGKARFAEKSCDHLWYAEKMLREFSGARMICIIRDGRDVVRSLRNAPWGPRKLSVAAACNQWIRFCDEARRLSKLLPSSQFTIVRYEKLMTDTPTELRRLCDFVGIEFEPAQLDESASAGPVQEIEAAWKKNATRRPDAQRVEAWRRCEDKQLIAELNCHLGATLAEWEYADPDVIVAPWFRQAFWRAKYLPYRRTIYPWVRRVRALLRRVGIGDRSSRGTAKSTEEIAVLNGRVGPE